MSATGRIKVLSEPLKPPAGCHYPEGSTLRVVTRTKRAKGDFYETPAWCIDEILPHLPFADATLVVDAGAGTGAIAARIAAKHPHIEIVGVEKNADLVAQARARELNAAEFVEANFESWQVEGGAPEIVIMNPPYSRALEFVKRALSIVKRGGTVAALLRISFLASKGRREFLRKHMPDAFVLSRRPSFTGGGTDACDYAWFVWGPSVSAAPDFAALIASYAQLPPLEDLLRVAYALGLACTSKTHAGGRIHLLAGGERKPRKGGRRASRKASAAAEAKA